MKKTGFVLAMLCFLAVVGCTDSSTMSYREMTELTKTAASSEVELEAWLAASHKAGPDGGLREVDTNGDGKVDGGDLTNEELGRTGVCKQWMVAAQAAGEANLWSLTEEPRKIACIQTSKNQIDIVATAHDEGKIYIKTLQSE